jgi:hypothetical protein
MSETTKLDRLTGPQVDALKLMLSAEIEAGTVAVTATTAQFAMAREQAQTLAHTAREQAGQQHGRRGGPYQALNAVVRKLGRPQ